MYWEKQQKSWFYRTFICGHWFSGQIKAEFKKKRNGNYSIKRHYRECQKCGKKIWIKYEVKSN